MEETITVDDLSKKEKDMLLIDIWLKDNNKDWGDVLEDKDGEFFMYVDGEEGYDKVYIMEEILAE